MCGECEQPFSWAESGRSATCVVLRNRLDSRKQREHIFNGQELDKGADCGAWILGKEFGFYPSEEKSLVRDILFLASYALFQLRRAKGV